ncbi:MAG TPA: hypothetical protein VI139_00015, partial [Gemmatimonadales bacterium]
TSTVDPYAGRPDGLCPANAPVRHYNIVAIQLPIQVTSSPARTDQEGRIYTLAQYKDQILAGQMPADPLAIRANVGDCIAVTLTNETQDTNEMPFTKVNIHIHHVQFDTEASDGVITGFEYEMSIRPHQLEDPNLASAANPGDTVIHLTSVSKFHNGVWIAVGEGKDSIEIHQIASIDAANNTLTLTKPITNAHASGEGTGVEFVQYRWYPDVELDNIFFHDHVDGIHSWGHGQVGQLIIEPKGSDYINPKTGQEQLQGTIMDIVTSNPLAPALGVNGSFRELALWTIDDTPTTDSSLNLRAAPFSDRSSADPSQRFSSYTYGDPITPLPVAYAGDSFVIRTINVSEQVDSLHVDGAKFFYENRFVDANGNLLSTATDTLEYGVSERYTLILQGGAGGLTHSPGDYIYNNTMNYRFAQGAWGIIRVLGCQSASGPEALPGSSVPSCSGGAAVHAAPKVPSTPSANLSGGSGGSGGNGAIPATTNPGNPCPANAPAHTFNVTAIDVGSSVVLVGGQRANDNGIHAAFVPTSDASAIASGKKPLEPLVLHVAQGQCVTVNFTNQRSGARASFHAGGELTSTPASSGIDVGFSSEQSVAPGQSRTYVYYADTSKETAGVVSDFGGDNTGTIGLYGGVVVSPAGATFTDPVTGAAKDIGSQVIVHVPGTKGYRDFTEIMGDSDPEIGQSHMPYPDQVQGVATINYATAGARNDDAQMLSSIVHGDPATPMLKAYAGDPVFVHALVSPGADQPHQFTLGGQAFPSDIGIPRSQLFTTRAVVPDAGIDAQIVNGAGGFGQTVGDFFYGDIRRSFTVAGMWGLMRVYPTTGSGCPIKPLDGLSC